MSYLRENHGQSYTNICCTLKNIVLQNNEIQIIYPLHFNPNMQKTVYNLVDGIDYIELIDLLLYPTFVLLISKSCLIITNCSWIQKKMPSLGKPISVMRENTKKHKAAEDVTVNLVEIYKPKIVSDDNNLLKNIKVYFKVNILHNPDGVGFAFENIFH